MKIFTIIKTIFITLIGLFIYRSGSSERENKELKNEINATNEIQKRVIKYDNTSDAAKRIWLRQYSKSRDK